MELIARYYETPTTPHIPITVELGTTIGDLIDGMNLPDHARELVVVTKGSEVLEGDYVVVDGDEIVIGIAQGKQVIGTIATIALAVVAPMIAPALLGTMGIAATTMTLAIASAGISLVGSLLIGALIPPPAVGGAASAAQADDVFFATGSSNTAKLFQNVPSVYGTHLFFPDLAATTRVDNVGVTSEIAMLLDCGIGDVEITDVRIGDTPASQLGMNVEVHRNTKDPKLKYISNMSSAQQFNVTITTTPTILTSSTGSTKLEAVFQFDRGLVEQKNDGSMVTASAGFDAQYRLVGTTAWIDFPNIMTGGKANYASKTISGDSLEPFVAVASVNGLTAGQYEVRATRATNASTNTRVNDSYKLIQLKSYKPGSPFDLDKKHTFVEVQGVASEKLSGQIQTLNVVAKRHIRDITATGWGAMVATSNPALIALDILTCEENLQPLKDAQIDFASFKKLRDICAGGKFTFNGVLRQDSTVKEQVSKVLSNARAQLTIRESGKIGVLIDEAGRVPRQLITPANSWDFSGSRNFPVYPDALRVTYTEPNADYQAAEVIVYDDGKDETNAQTYEDMPTIGITNRQEAWNYGRYMMAQAKMRNETFTVKLDIEHLAVQRGDVVTVQHDVPKFGGAAARVVSVAGAVVTIDQIIAGSGTLGARVRQVDGTIVSEGVVSAIGDQVTLANPIAGLDYGDLIVIGQLGQETRDYIVIGIEPDANLSAQLTLVPYVEEVYTADTGTIPDWKPGFGTNLISGTDLGIDNVVGTYEITYENRFPFGEVYLSWAPSGTIATLDHYNVIRMNPDGSREVVATTLAPSWNERIDLLNNRDRWNQDSKYIIEPVNILGNAGSTGTTTVKVLPDTTPPKEVDGFGVNVVNNTSVDIYWRFNPDPDIAYYDLRYSPKATNATWQEAQGLAKVDHPTNRTTVGARTGTYFISAVDTSGNKSTPIGLRTSVEKLPALDLIVNIDDSPTWNGTLTDMQIKNGNLMLAGGFGSVVSRGVYTYDSLFDAGEIEELRVQAKMLVYGVTADDVMSSWVRLSDVTSMARADADDFDAWLEVRTADKFRMMADWTTVAGEDPIASTGQGWAPWRRVESADLTGRIFQFRIVCESSDPNVNVVVESADVEIDVAERYESYPDVAVTNAAGGVQINFNPPFRSIPTLAVTVDGNTHDIGYEVVSKSKSNAVIILHDARTDKPITGKIDVAALGWGKQRSNPI